MFFRKNILLGMPKRNAKSVKVNFRRRNFIQESIYINRLTLGDSYFTERHSEASSTAEPSPMIMPSSVSISPA